MARFVSMLGQMGLDSGNCEAGTTCGVLIEAPMAQRGGSLWTEGSCAADDSAHCPTGGGPLPPGEGEHGVLDIYICC
jgi:hypothetical protein